VVAPLAVALLFQRLGARQWAALLLTALAGAAFLGYYNARVTGDALHMAYSEYDVQYPMTSHFNVLPLPPARVYREFGLTWVDHWERAAWLHAHGYAFFVRRAMDFAARVATFTGSPFVLLPCLLFAGKWWRDRNFRVVGLAIGLTVGIAFIEVLYFDHYAAPLLAPLLILVVEGFRCLRSWKLRPGMPTGVWLTRTVPVAALLMAVLPPATTLLRGGSLSHFAAGGRELLEQSLEADFGPHLILVRHTNPSSVEPDWGAYPRLESAPVLVEFVHNGANIDQQFIVWANDMGDEANRKLLDYYKQRMVWLYSPEENPDMLIPLPQER
jgi:hypothetical protein